MDNSDIKVHELLTLTKTCGEALNNLSEAFIKLSIAHVALMNKIEELDTPTLFDSKDETT